MLGFVPLIALLAPVLGSGFFLQPVRTQHVPAVVAIGVAQRVGVPSPVQTMELTISLPSRNELELQSLVRAIYDPGSPLFHHFLSVAQFTERYGPSESNYRSLVEFARANRLHARALARNRRALDVYGAVADVERAFHTTIRLYRDPDGGRIFYAPDREPSLQLRVPVLHVTGLDDYDVPVPRVVLGSEFGDGKHTGSGPSGNFTGADVRAAYYGGTALTGAGQSVGLFEYAGYELSDIRTYFQRIGERNDVPIVGVSLNGASLRCTGKCNDAEQALDIEEALSLAPGLEQLVVYVGHNDVSILNQMASDDTSKQLGCSWGWGPDPTAIDPIFEEMAAQGQSFLVATGDYGYKLKRGGVWPADDAYVTAVGGTDLSTDGPGGAWRSERGWRFSGGGPSPDDIPIPNYQVPFINAQNGGSTTLRNVPDVAGEADTDNFSCFHGHCYTGVGGTSFAAPIWAGFMALTNQYAAATGKPPIGFMNPELYRIGGDAAYAKAFHDEVAGFNGLYYAEPGFDLVTGFGSPNGDAFIRVLVDRNR